MSHYYKIINKKKWYYRLIPKKDVNGKPKKGLFTDYPRNTLTSNLIVSWSYNDKVTNNVLRLYSVFKSYLEFGMFQLKLPQHERCFYEIILGESNQKPHFDIDIDIKADGNNNNNNNNIIDGNKVTNNLITAILTVLSEKGIDLNLSTDILVYTSHGKEKQSYHVVINNYCHVNNMEAKAFYNEVINHVPEEDRQWLDSAVYSPTQQFRIVGSQKIGSDRTKILHKKWEYNGSIIEHRYPENPDSPEHEMVMNLEASIVGFTGNCKFLPVFVLDEPVKEYVDCDDVETKDAIAAIQLVASAGKISVHDSRFPYKFAGINGPVIMLKRIRPSKCKICQRVHEHENPYLLIMGEEKNVYFFCRRDPHGKKLYLGCLNPSSPYNNNQDNNNQDNNTNNNNKSEMIKINWSKNVVDRVQKLARAEDIKKKGNKKYVSLNTDIDPKHKKMLIQMFLAK
jgi:hypothetical protein